MTGALSAQPGAPIDLSSPRRLHVIGVGGPGMSAIAIALAEMGHRVSGSDIREQPSLDRVRAAGVDVRVGHSREAVHGCDAVTWSTAIPERNIERDEAVRVGVPSMHRSGMLASICARAQSIGVAGTHGKTSTASMLMLVLHDCGLRPGFVIGGDVTDMGTGAQWTGGEWFVVEADESDGTHLALPLAGTILTNVESDHLDHYGSLDGIIDGFRRYLRQVAGPRVLCADDPVCAVLAAELRRDGVEVITYGTDPAADVVVGPITPVDGVLQFDLTWADAAADPVPVRLPLRGRHNALNAAAVLAMAVAVGAPRHDAARSLARFGGVARRFDVRAVIDGITLVDDYAHLPSEIAAVLGAARTSGDDWTRVVAVFQPNRYNRMAVMWPDYADAFVDADIVVLTDIYASGTTPIPGVTGKLVVNAVLDRHPASRVVWLPRRHDLVDYLASSLRPGDVCISMGCGDIASLPDDVEQRRGSGR